MATALFENVSDAYQQKLANDMQYWYENNTPTYQALDRYFPQEPITEKGVRIPFVARRPGGHGGWLPSNSSFNAATPPRTDSMYAFPVGYAMPAVLGGSLITALRQGDTQAKMTFAQYMEQYTQAATKRFNQMINGDGSGVLGYAGSTHASTGSATLTCDTTPVAAIGHTKGGVRFEEGHTYQAINASTNAIRGTFTVTTPGTSSCVINITSGSITSGDPIVDPNSWQRWYRGLWHLIGNTSRIIQGKNTTSNPQLNDPIVDLAGQYLNPAAFRSVKSALQVRNNDVMAENNLFCNMTPGQYTVLLKQGYNLRFYVNGNNGKVTGVANTYEDGDTLVVRDADAEEDKIAFWMKEGGLKKYVERDLQMADLDGQQFRMLFGANNTGSDDYQTAWVARIAMVKEKTRQCAGIIRASVTGVETQASVGAA